MDKFDRHNITAPPGCKKYAPAAFRVLPANRKPNEEDDKELHKRAVFNCGVRQGRTARAACVRTALVLMTHPSHP
jgi:hypothetical protein